MYIYITCTVQEKVDPNYTNIVVASLFHFTATYSLKIPGTVSAAILIISHTRTHIQLSDAKSLSACTKKKREMLD